MIDYKERVLGASVLLDENDYILAWNTGHHCWKTVMEAFNYLSDTENFNEEQKNAINNAKKLKVDYIEIDMKSVIDEKIFFEVTSVAFYKKYKIHSDFKLAIPYNDEPTIAEKIIDALDSYAKDYDSHEYGLPIYNKHMDKMKEIVTRIIGEELCVK